MRWFKHMTHSAQDEKLCHVIDELGLEGYGFYWRILEIIASQMDETDKTFCEYSPKTWGKFVGFSAIKFSKLAEVLNKNHLFFVEISEKTIRIDCPNLLKYKDEYSNRKQKNRDSVGTKSGEYREQERETETETETDIKEGSKEKSKKKKSNSDSESFAKFYSVYPKRVGKAEAIKAWNKIKPNDELTEIIVKSIADQIQWREEADSKGLFYPEWKNPATWINGKCWNDENYIMGARKNGLKQSQSGNDKYIQRPVSEQAKPYTDPDTAF